MRQLRGARSRRPPDSGGKQRRRRRPTFVRSAPQKRGFKPLSSPPTSLWPISWQRWVGTSLFETGGAPQEDLSCPFCGLSTADFKRSGAPGVPPVLSHLRDLPERPSEADPREHATRGEGLPPSRSQRFGPGATPDRSAAEIVPGRRDGRFRKSRRTPGPDPDPRARDLTRPWTI